MDWLEQIGKRLEFEAVYSGASGRYALLYDLRSEGMLVREHVWLPAQRFAGVKPGDLVRFEGKINQYDRRVQVLPGKQRFRYRRWRDDKAVTVTNIRRVRRIK